MYAHTIIIQYVLIQLTRIYKAILEYTKLYCNIPGYTGKYKHMQPIHVYKATYTKAAAEIYNTTYKHCICSILEFKLVY